MLEIALASQSPRRRELLQTGGFDFRVFPVKVSEIFDENLTPTEVVSHLATVKGRAAIDLYNPLKSPGFLILSADTIVVFENYIFGKPENTSQAKDYLHLLSGNAHSVISGIALFESGSTKVWTGWAETNVQFRALSDQEIDSYVASGEPMDKAGAYAIQGDGGKFISSYEGSWSNVVGLPMELLESALRKNGWHVRRRTP
jgi:septum formation protein